MVAPPDDMRVLRLSTDDVPERDRLAVVREVYGRIIRLEFEPLVDAPLRYQFAVRTLPGVAVSQVVSSPTWARRTRELVADGNDSAFLCVPNHGGFKASHLGRELFLRCGEALLLSAAEPSAGLNVATSSCLNIAVPRKVLAAMVPTVEDSFMRPIAQKTEALMLLRSYVSVLEDQRELSTPELRQAIATHLHDLIALTLGASRDVAEVAANRGVRSARLRAVKADIVRDLTEQNLNVNGLAARHGITPRYVQKLFEHEGTTFSRFLLDQRLARSHRVLSDPRLAERSISAVAYEAGFGDLSHFNRAFRRRYGESPSDVRSSARRNGS